ncbi:MAG: hypothetical protein V4661_10235, partial [Pseudomonadota bacterium]
VGDMGCSSLMMQCTMQAECHIVAVFCLDLRRCRCTVGPGRVQVIDAGRFLAANGASFSVNSSKNSSKGIQCSI